MCHCNTGGHRDVEGFDIAASVNSNGIGACLLSFLGETVSLITEYKTHGDWRRGLLEGIPRVLIETIDTVIELIQSTEYAW